MKEDDYCVVVYKILNYMYECLRTDTRVSYGLFENDGVLFPKLNKKYWQLIENNLKENGYIDVDVTSFYTSDNFDGSVKYAEVCTYKITTKGIEYMYKNFEWMNMLETGKQIIHA